jgi:hypothetical protein
MLTTTVQVRNVPTLPHFYGEQAHGVTCPAVTPSSVVAIDSAKDAHGSASGT